MNSAHPGPYAGIPLWLRPITRRPGEVQFGVIEGGPIVTGVTPDEARLLARLDGSLPADALGAVAKASGVSRRRWRVLLDLVARLGLLEPAPVRPIVGTLPDGAGSPPAPAHVLIDGAGALSRDLVRLLGHDTLADVRGARVTCGGGVGGGPGGPGCGQVDCGLHRARCARAGGGPAVCRRPRGRHRPRPSTGRRLAATRSAPPAGRHRGCASRRRAARRRRPGAPCLWCLDLHRSDRDEAWPTVMAQVAQLPDDHGTLRAGPDAGEALAHPGEPGLAQLVAGTVAALWLARWPVSDPRPEWPSR